MLERFARYALGVRGRPLPDHVAHHATRAVVDWVAATVIGGTMAPARVLAEAVAEPDEHGHARLVPGGRRVTARSAALVNGTAAHTAEVDDIFRDGIYHPGAPTIAAALATAQRLDATGPALLRAVVVGYEISNRVAARVNPAHYRYWHTTGTIGTLGAAAAVAELLELDPPRFAHALATSATVAAGLQQAFRSDAMSKPLHAGHAADAGTLAALGAAGGLTGALDVLDGPAGLGAGMSDAPDWAAALDGLGETAPTVTRMTVKNHTACGHTFAAIDATLRLRDAHALTPADVAGVRVDTYATATRVAGNPSPATAFEAKFSIAYCVAAALHAGSVRLAAFEPAMLHDPEVRALTGRVDVAAADDLDALFPGRRAARVTLTTRDGRVLTEEVLTRRGDPDDPLSDADLTGKFAELAAPTLGEDAARSAVAALWRLPDAGSVRDLPLYREADRATTGVGGV